MPDDLLKGWHMRKYLFVLIFIMVGCTDFKFLSEDDFCYEQPTVAQDYARFVLPPDYDNLEAHCTRWMDHTTIDVRFEMSPDHLEQFQDSTEIEQWETVVDVSKVERFELLDERRFHAMTTYLYGENSEHLLASGTQQIFIDTTNPLQYTVYLTYFASY
jgi:hypothetical protein